MNIELAAILQILPHRPPFLFLDRVTSVVPLESGIGIKNVTADEEIMGGYLPKQMAFPGSLTLEMLAQTAAVICAAAGMAEAGAIEKKMGSGYLVSADLRCENTIRPGDILEAHVEIIKAWGRFIMAKGKVAVGDEPVAEGRFTIAAA